MKRIIDQSLEMIRLSIVVLLLLCTNLSKAQDDRPQVVPPPPGVAEIEKYGSIPTTYYTGLPGINIPIYTLKSKSIEVPISISYHAQGIKVNDVSGPVGLGWSLNAGGYLTKTVNGIEDGAGTSGFSSQSEITAYAAQYVNDMEQMYCNTQDNDIDIYSYSTPNSGGKFFYDNLDNIHFMPHQKNEVFRDTLTGGFLQSYRLKDINGLEYFFNDLELQEPLYTSGELGCKYSSGVSETFKLSTITSIDGGEIIFIYDTISYSYLTDHNEFRIVENGVGQYDISDSESWSGVDITDGRRLIRIETTEGFSVDFEYTGDVPGKVTKITISYREKEIKWFDFTYSSFSSNGANTPFPIPTVDFSERSKLVSINESGKGKYDFEYDLTALPPRFSFAQDYWGYYNGADLNNTLIPDKSIEGFVYPFTFATGDRQANPTYSKAGIITQITYPTGGITKFNFEPNEHPHPDIDTSGCLTGFKTNSQEITAQAISGLCSELVQGTVSLSIPTGSKQLKLYFDSNMDGHGVPPLACVDNESSLYFLVTYGTNNLAITSEQTIDIGDYDGSVDVSYMVNGNGDDFQLLWSTLNVVWQEPFTKCTDLAGNEPQQTLGGLRLASQTDWPSISELPITKNYTYDSAVYQFLNFTSRRQGYFNVLGDPCWFPATLLTVSSRPAVAPNTLFGGSTIYNRVTEFHGNNPDNCYEENGQVVCPNVSPPLGKTVFSYDHQPDGLVVDLNGNGVIVDYSHRRGQLLESKVYSYDSSSQDFIIASHTTNTYGKSLDYMHYGLRVYRIRREESRSGCFTFDAIYTYLDYPYYSEWVHKDETISKQYFYDASLTLSGSREVLTEYTYNGNNLMPQIVETTFPEIEEKTQYSFGLPEVVGEVTNVKSYSKESSSDPFTLISETEYTFQNIDSAIVLTDQLVFRNSDTLTNFSLFRDNQHRIVRVVDNLNDISMAYAYGDEFLPYPTTQCSNCQTVMHEGFEFHEDSLFDSNAKSGKYIYNLSNGNISISAPSNYTIDYWKKTSLNSPWVKITGASYSFGSFIISGSGYIDHINVFPPDGIVSNYTYDPGWGISSTTDQNGQSQYYSYDQFGRLIELLDNNRSVIQRNIYHYTNQ